MADGLPVQIPALSIPVPPPAEMDIAVDEGQLTVKFYYIITQIWLIQAAAYLCILAFTVT
jgi:hypothetical protein